MRSSPAEIGVHGVGHANPKTYDTIHAANTCRAIVWHATCSNTWHPGRGDVLESRNFS
jgi:hypothetical protein